MKKNRFHFLILLVLFFSTTTLISCSVGLMKRAPSPASVEKDSVSSSEVKKEEEKESVPRPEARVEEDEALEFIAEEEMDTDSGAAGYAAEKSSSPKRKKSKRTTPKKSGLKAGYSDDNKQYNYFLSFLEKFKKQVPHYPISIQERIVLRVVDENGEGVPNAKIEIRDDGELLEEGLSYSDGTYLFFPSEHHSSIRDFSANLSWRQNSETIQIDRDGKRTVEVALSNLRREPPQSIPVDLLFIFDTTGSMGEEVERLKATIELIHMNLSALSSKLNVELRFGMVLYRDKGDEYVTRTVPLTADLDSFQAVLNRLTVDGGGDYPEDLQSALSEAMIGVKWRKGGIKAGFIITDAPPHLDYNQKFTYVKAAAEAKKRGVKLFSIGTGGLNVLGEYILRQISQYTYAKYIFLSYGEKGESEGGRPGSVSHHTGANYQTDKLESIIIKLMRDEIKHYSGQAIQQGEDFFQAKKIDEEKNEETLQNLFGQAVDQLVDYSSMNISRDMPVAVVPIDPKDPSLKANAEYFTNALTLAASQNKKFKMLARTEYQKIEDEIEFQVKDLIAGKRLDELGEKLGAELLIVGELYEKRSNFELFLKLLHVKTGEILAVTKAKIDKQLGM